MPDCSRRWLQRLIRRKVALDTVLQSDGWRGYNGLVDLGYKKHFRVHRGANEFASGKHHINSIESFWSFAKGRLSKFNGMAPGMLYFHLKESEFCFNHRNDNLYAILLELIRNNPLN